MDEDEWHIHPLLSAWLLGVSGMLTYVAQLRRSFEQGSVISESQFRVEVEYCEAKFGTKYPFDIIYQLAQAWSVVVADLIGGIGALCSEEKITFSCLPLVRMAEEYSARIAWLLDDDATVEQRAARALLEDANGASEMAIAATHTVGKEDATRKYYRNRLKMSRALVLQMFPSSIVENEPNQWSVIGETTFNEEDGPQAFEEKFQRPSATAEIFGKRWIREGSWEGFYHYLSACVHPGIGVLEYFELDGGVENRLRTETSLNDLDLQVSVALISHYQSMHHLVSYLGYPSEVLQEIRSGTELFFPGLLTELDPEPLGKDFEE